MSDAAARQAALRALLRRRMAAHGGRIPFRDYMDAALYAPGLGYYAAGTVALGRGGDFVTSPEVDPAFGRLLARWLAQVDAALGRPAPFAAVEMGAGTGRLAADILAALDDEAPDLARRLAYRIVERSPALRARQEALLAHRPQVAWLDGLAALPPGSVTGAFLSNELVDAFPVHRITQTDAGLREIYVVPTDDGGFQDQIGPPVPGLAAHFAWLGVQPPPGTQGEVNLDAVAWLRQVGTALARGAVLTIDYGDTAARLYSELRPAGTLLCYTQGRVTDDPYAAPGATDMTAHVDFTALQQAGAAVDLRTVMLTRQLVFLAELGLGDLLAGLRDHYSAQAATVGPRAATDAWLAERARLFRLVDPDALGRFHVLVQSKGMRYEVRGTRDEG